MGEAHQCDKNHRKLIWFDLNLFYVKNWDLAHYLQIKALTKIDNTIQYILK